MAKDILMPQMGYDMTQGTIVRWTKKVGERVTKGDIVAEIETDKATVEIEAFDSGTLLRVLAEPGQTVPVGQPIATLGSADEKLPDAPAAAPAPEPKKEEPAPAATPQPREDKRNAQPAAPARPAAAPRRVAAAPASGDIRSTPMARQRAQELGVDLAQVQGSGPGGRILHSDVDAFAEANAPRESPATEPEAQPAGPAKQAPPLPEGAEDIELSRLRQTIARRMVESKTTTPHFYVSMDVSADSMLAVREELAKKKIKVSVNDLLVRALALAVAEHPQVNAMFLGDKVRRFKRIDIGIAIATDNGLMSPAILDVAAKKPEQIAKESRDLAERARSGHLRGEEAGGGTVTLSNLGMFGVDQFLAIINPPQAMIVSVGQAAERVVAVDGQPRVARVLTLWAAGDHRVIDGADVARFLATLKQRVEDAKALL